MGIGTYIYIVFCSVNVVTELVELTTVVNVKLSFSQILTARSFSSFLTHIV